MDKIGWDKGLFSVPTGDVSGFDVLDIDPRHGGRIWYEASRARLPATRIHRTRSGGVHILFKHLEGLRNSSGKIAPGIDVRAGGGYIIWWPSTGLASKDPPASGLPEWPLWLLPSMMSKPAAPPAPYPHGLPVSTPRKLEGIFKAVANAREGERNALTHWGACRIAEMVRAGEVGQSLGAQVIAEAATRAGIPRAEAIATIRSGMRQ